jgi:hypothetical protein
VLVLVFGCLLLIFIRRHPWHSTRRESFSHFKLTCQRKLSIVRSSYCAKFSVGSFDVNYCFVWHCPSKKSQVWPCWSKKSSIASYWLMARAMVFHYEPPYITKTKINCIP